MKKHFVQVMFRLAAVAALCIGGTQVVRADDHVVEMIADKDNRFKLPDGKDVVTLKAGETVRFKINSLFGGEKARDGAVHSFVVRKLRDKGWSVRLKEGVQEFTLTAPPPGNYLIECTVECGPGHETMSIKMVVTK
ncbi:MAG: hypothetical protein U0Q16_23385 [Bryobacteraceae bacterium]